MSSSIVKYASQETNSTHEDNKERIDLPHGSDLTAPNLSLPAETLLQAAISLKDKVVQVTWRGQWNDYGNTDPTVYTGLLGTAFTCLRAYEATGSLQDLSLCTEIVDTCASIARSSTRHLTFLCGRGGVYALGAVAANYCGDQQKRDLYMDRFFEVAQERALPVGPEEGGFGMSYDLLYGRAGFLWTALFINKHLGAEAVPSDLLMPVVEAVLAGGRAGASDNTACPLMYRWHGTRYWGAAHGLAGILHVLLHFQALSADDIEDVKGTLRYMMSNRFPRSGNYPVSEGNPRDKLVQWSHGATGIGITLCKASEVLPTDREFRNAAIEAGEVVWKSGLVKKVGLADGAAGNAYAFLSLYRLTGESIYEDRAKAFANCLYHDQRNATTSSPSTGADHAYSLFQGLAGVACLWFDLLAPEKSKFPGYEI
ncbi:lanC-like protein GCL1 [Coffea arabica]|uniref:LanC-like protein GCL1 n=1 Tax=Coffea arabica TaxID=13443 RepID=A0A6P6TAC3_COFAR|nr:lanC-like protein GCL1 [Coffea arabica]